MADAVIAALLSDWTWTVTMPVPGGGQVGIEITIAGGQTREGEYRDRLGRLPSSPMRLAVTGPLVAVIVAHVGVLGVAGIIDLQQERRRARNRDDLDRLSKTRRQSRGRADRQVSRAEAGTAGLAWEVATTSSSRLPDVAKLPMWS